MRETSIIDTGDSKYSFLLGRTRNFFRRHPGWWVWIFSIIVWVYLAIIPLFSLNDGQHLRAIIYCRPMWTFQPVVHPDYPVQGLSQILTSIPNGIAHWIIMVVAMMFPLLNEPVKHVAFSVRRKHRNIGVLWFLIGYTITLAAAGILFLLLPLLLDRVIEGQASYVNGSIKASAFVVAAILTWLPNRGIRMMKCGQTMPIRIDGWRMQFDSMLYGLKMGTVCLTTCWAIMAALMIAHHNVILMYLVTIVLICERYLLPHTSRLPGYAWIIMGLFLFGIEMWA